MRNYLRVRGEKLVRVSFFLLLMELPPRTRRKGTGAKSTTRWWGTTSAYAEKSAPKVEYHDRFMNYLRVRGEKETASFKEHWHQELPPRTRRKACLRIEGRTSAGTTSAYAEKSVGLVRPKSESGNYLRVRGEKISLQKTQDLTAELPPRTRRKELG
ncbi:hypothetical protein CULC0102_0028 [Corynebacterium ulcerans 0102]|nr:hypothetical protein CULC0102_0028 [Corynebacterium ulcerans 0102]